jgi:hypothetical protein
MTWRYLLASSVLVACVGGEPSLGTTRDNIDSTDPFCSALTPAQLHDAAMVVYANQVWNPQSCGGDTNCPCGSYCSTDEAICAVECVPNPAPGEPTCGAGKACTTAGRCADAPNDPPPALAISIAFGEAAVSANTTTGPVSLAIQVTTIATATSLAALDDAEAATVHFSIREVREQQLGLIDDPPPVSPLIKCTSAGAFTTDCDLAGGWSYDLVGGAYRSQRTIWVQVPQTATPLHWTLEARSANASGTTTEVINATPVVTPATDPGHYKGTLSYANSDTASPAISIPVEAIVTAGSIVVLEPTKLVFADGQVVIPRTTEKATRLGWLNASGARYDVELGYTDAAYDPTRGHLDATLELGNGTGAESTSLTLSLDRTGDVDAPACPCAAGSYCNTRMGACLPGTAPTDQASVDPTTYRPSSMLASAAVTAWTSPLLTAVAAAGGSSMLAGTGHTLLQEAYCYNPTFATAGMLDPSTTSPTSGDLVCAFGAAGHTPQRTFSFEEASSDYVPGTGSGAAQDMLDSCTADLAAPPTGSTVASLIPTRSCASPGRFYLALAAGRGTGGVGVPAADIDQRLVMQILRQWLGVTAYVAHTGVQDRDYDDALSISGAPAYQRFGTMLDQVDADLRVLLDPEVEPQFTTGAALTTVLAQPDYRVRPRPVAHWSFNSTASPGLDSEGTNPLAITGTPLSNNTLFAQTPGAQCRSTAAIAAGDHRFSIVFVLDYKPALGSTATVFYKLAPNGDRLSIDATPGTTSGSMNLRMYDTHGGSVTFAGASSGMIAIAVDGASYTLYSSPMGTPSTIATIVGVPVNGGPGWGAAGTVNLNVNLTSDTDVCTSWDLNALYDGGDYTTRAPYVVHSATYRYTCKDTVSGETCSGTPLSASKCTTAATTLRPTLLTQIQNTMVSPQSPPPSGPLNALTTRGALAVVDEQSQWFQKWTLFWTDWRCDTTVTGFINPGTRHKPVCPGMKASWDEVSVWDRPLQPSEFADMAARYIATSDTLPAVRSYDGSEQATALPVHMLEAAAADLELLAAYAAAERSQAYGECYLGGHSAALDRVAQRGGPNLRLVSLLEGEADHLAAIGGGEAATWYARYTAAKQQLAGRRAIAVQALLETAKCENPLGVSEQDIPLYVGEDVGANAKFFASSHYLADQAQNEINTASQLLLTARTAYTNQRQQAYQLEETAATRQERMGDLRANTESQLSHYCGSTQSSTSLFDALQQGTTTANNCFIDRLLPQCASFATATLESLPAECLRGELGSQVLAIKTAGVVMTNADSVMHDTIDRYNGDLEHCAQEQAAFDGDETILHEHDQEMEKLHNEQALFDSVMGVAKVGLDFANPFGLTDPEAAFHGAMDTIGLVAGFGDSQFATAEQEENDSYNEEVMHRNHDETLATCFHDVDNEKYQIDNARDQLLLAKQQLENATHQLSVEVDQVGSITSIALGQLATEDTLSATPPHLHFWLDQSISDYHSHLAAARRLTYLALRALEYEAQISLGLRSATLTAAVPSALQTVVNDIRTVNAPLAGQLGVSVEDKTIVLSLRDEILKLSQSTANVSGDLVLTPVQQFQRYLRANSSIILDAKGKPIGRGIRFAIAPDTWNTTMCDERIWRIQPSLQIDNPPNQHTLLLYQDNTFGSQDCHADPGTVLVSHADPKGNLLLDDAFELPTLALPQPYVASNVDGPTGLDHETLKNQPQSAVATFAGRGLYSNYVLLFPEPLWSDDDIADVKDVLLRFDISAVTNAPHI